MLERRRHAIDIMQHSGHQMRDEKISKALTKLLRHKALEYDIDMRPDGFCSLDEVLACPCLASLRASQADVKRLVVRDSKQRFQCMEIKNKLLIRAVQGHSLKVVEDNRLLQRVTRDNLPQCCVHGTYWKHWESIKRSGLLAGGRRGQTFRAHVHFSSFPPSDQRIISGMRSDCELAIWIDLEKALHDKLPLYFSANHVLLSPGINGVIDRKYFVSARDLKTLQEVALN